MTTTHAIEFVLTVLAVYRLTLLVTSEDGPFCIFARIRYSTIAMRARSWCNLECCYCFSVQLSALAACTLEGTWALNWLAIAGGTALLFRGFPEPAEECMLTE